VVGISDLRAFLDTRPRGPIPDASRLIELLASCWHDFAGSSETNMQPEKLARIEDPDWNPPILTFKIERHAQTVMGSTRASLYEWSLDLESRTASIMRKGRRQLRPIAKKLDVKPIAESLADAIINGRRDDRIKIMADASVKIDIGRIIPETNQQTTTDRRKRLRRCLTALLEPHGWKELRANVYARR
jgi:hypothetical protein